MPKLNLKLNNSTFYFLFSTFYFLFSTFHFLDSTAVFAAELNLISQTKEINAGQQFQVDVILNTEGEEINAVEGTIVFPSDLLLFKEARDGNSIINFWVEQPMLKTREKMAFSGIMPGGYVGSQGALFSLIFQANKEGYGAIEFRDARALKNDGLGTSASLKISNFQFLIRLPDGQVSKQTPISQIPISEAKDSDPPEKFRPEIAQNPNLFDGKYFLVFTTQDKGVGMSHYEVREGRAEFIVARSPYLLTNQKLDKKIFIKAVDKNGNERVEIFYPPNFRPWYKNYWILAILMVIGLLIAYLDSRVLWARKA